MSLLSSEYFPKVFSWLVYATSSAKIGMMCFAMENLSDLFSKPDPFAALPTRFFFEFSPSTGLGILSMEEAALDTEATIRLSPGHEDDKIAPSKRVKRDCNNI